MKISFFASTLLILLSFPTLSFTNTKKNEHNSSEHSSSHYTKENKSQIVEGNTEVIIVSYTKTVKSINDTRTSDNLLIYPEQVVSSQHTVGNLISHSAGIHLNGQGGLFQSYNIRGFSRARIKTEVDGIPIITDRRAGNSVSFIPAPLISEVYIQKGPQSALYGSNAMGGVVSLFTQTHHNSSINMTIQPKNNEKHLSFNFVTDTLNASAIHRTADNANSPRNGQTPSSLLNTQYQQSVASLSTNVNWHDIDIFASAIISQGKDIGKSAITFPQKRISSYPQDDHLLSQITFSSAGQWQFKLYQHHQQWQNEVTRLNDSQSISRRNLIDYGSDTYGAYGSWLMNNTVLGVEWFSRKNIDINEQEFFANNELAWQKNVINANEDTFALFTLHDWYFNDFTLATGARYDQIKLSNFIEDKQDNNQNIGRETKTDDFLSLSANANYDVSKNTVISFQVANAFRFPTVSELFFSGQTPRGNTQGNSQLTPEKSIAFQYSLTHNYSQNFNITFNGYHYIIDDYIERYTQDNVRLYRNNHQVTIKGFELINHWQINQQWQSILGFQWQQGEDDEHNVVDDGVPKSLKWSINWQNNMFNIRQQLTYQFSQQDVGPSEIPQDSEIIWHTTIDYQMNKHLVLSMSLLNLTNNLYKGTNDEDAAYQPERSISFSGIWQF